MTAMRIGDEHLTPYTPELVEKIRTGTDRTEHEYPYGYRLDRDEITFNQWVDGFDFKTVTDPENDEEAEQYADRVFSARVDKSEVQFLEKYPNLTHVEYTEEKSTVLPDEIAERESIRFLKFDCTKKFKKLPRALPEMKQLEALSIVNIAALRDISLLRELPNLRYLQIYGCSKVEDFSSLASLEKLEELQLQSMWWDGVPDVIAELPNLKRLSLDSSVRSEKVDLSVLAELEDLEELAFQFTDLEATPPEFAGLKNLRKLKFEHCNFQNYDSIAALRNLEVLDTYGLEFESVPGSFGELPNLRYLKLSSAPNLSDLTALKSLAIDRLDLSVAGFESVPSEVGALKSLRELKLNQSPNLTDVSGVAGLDQLDYLDLGFLKLDGYPEVVNTLTNLRVLNVNSAKYPLDKLAEHPSLEFVYIGFTHLKDEIPGTRRIEHQSGLIFERD
jgi:Leucine-rich repeat (LRR) protein